MGSEQNNEAFLSPVVGTAALVCFWAAALSEHSTAQRSVQWRAQGVHDVVDVVEKPMRPGDECSSKMVFIGRDLDEHAIRTSFQACDAA